MFRSIQRFFRRSLMILTWGVLYLSPRTHFSYLRIREIKKGLELRPMGNFLILVIYRKYGVGEEIMHLIKEFDAKGYNILLISNGHLPAKQYESLSRRCFAIMQRNNIGHDFGAYKDGILYLHSLKMKVERLVLLNDSIIPTPRGLGAFIDKLAKIADFGGATESFQPVYHIQSYCLCFSGRVFFHPAFLDFWRGYRTISDRFYAIKHGELLLSKRLLSAGLKAEALYTHEALAASLMEWEVDQLYFLGAFLDDRFNNREIEKYRKIFANLSEDNPDLPEPVALEQHDRRTLRQSYMRLQLAKRLAVKRQAVEYLIDYLSHRSTIHYAAFLFMELFQFPFIKRNLCKNEIFALPRVQEVLRIVDVEDRQHMVDCLKVMGK